jgi:hypothetical protein
MAESPAAGESKNILKGLESFFGAIRAFPPAGSFHIDLS